MALVRHADDPAPLLATGSWRGRILEEPLGDGGFGYDPLFWVAEEGCSSAQLSKERKNRLSHRGRALAALLRLVESELEGAGLAS
jgi:XTP/dITP diphosphohydrolase